MKQNVFSSLVLGSNNYLAVYSCCKTEHVFIEQLIEHHFHQNFRAFNFAVIVLITQYLPVCTDASKQSNRKYRTKFKNVALIY